MQQFSLVHAGVSHSAEYEVCDDTLLVYRPNGEVRRTELARPTVRFWDIHPFRAIVRGYPFGGTGQHNGSSTPQLTDETLGAAEAWRKRADRVGFAHACNFVMLGQKQCQKQYFVFEAKP